MTRKLCFLAFGFYFGFVLSRVGASDYSVIHRMFTAEDLHLAWVILTAIIVANLGMRYLKAKGNLGRDGKPIEIKQKTLGRFSVLGAAIFGIGWGMAGACPGTVLAQIGEGKILALFTLSGMLVGTYLYGYLLAHWPAIKG